MDVPSATAHKQTTVPSAPGVTLPEPLRMAAQHIRLLQNKRRTLAEALVGAELQFLAALRREADAGHTTWPLLRDAYTTLSAGRLRGLDGRWTDLIGISPEKVIANAERETICAGGVWKGHWPLRRGERYPPTGKCVVYVLFDADIHPIYVHGTNRCALQFARHQAHGKQYLSWLAYGCVDRAEANMLEARLQRRYQLHIRSSAARNSTARSSSSARTRTSSR
jgi:hypothetical protein